MKKWLIAGAVLAAVGVGYVVFKGGAPGGSSAGGMPLDHVPADTAFVFANLEPVPDAVSRAWMKQFGDLSGLYTVQAKLLDRKLATADSADPASKWLRAVLAALKDKTPEQALDTIGFDMHGHYALFESMGQPVARIELAKPDHLRDFIAKVEQEAHDKLPVAKLDTMDYWNFAGPEGSGKLVAAIDGKQLVLAILRPDADDAAARRVLGLTRPDKSLAASDKLAQLNRTFGYTPFSSGYVDTRRVLALIDAAKPAADAPDAAALKASCNQEYDAIAAAVPRLVFGYTRMEPKAMETKALLELRKDIAADFQTVPAPMPGADAAASSMLHFGFAMDINAFATVMNKQADAIIAAPYRCPLLTDLNDGAARTKEAFSSPGLYMSAGMFNAIHVIANRFTMPKADSPGTTDFAGKLLIGSKNPAGLVGMLAGFSPQLAALNLKADGELKQMPSDPSMPFTGPMYAVMNDQAIGVSVGDGESDSLKAALSAKADNKSVFTVGYSGAFFATMFAATEEQLETADDPEAAEMAKVMRDIQRLYAEAFNRIDMDVRVADSGIEVVQQMSMK